MIIFFIKRMVYQPTYFIKFCLLIGLTLFASYLSLDMLNYRVNHYLQSEAADYATVQSLIPIYEKDLGNLSKKEEENLQLSLQHFYATVASYEAVAEKRYKDFPQAHVASVETEAALYEKSYAQIPPGYFVSTSKEFSQYALLEKFYYQDFVNQKPTVTENDVLKGSAKDGFLFFVGYWWNGFLPHFNLTSLLLLAPFVFGVGLLSKDKRRPALFSSMSYSNTSYIKDYTLSVFLHSVLCQLFLLALYFIPLVFLRNLGSDSIGLSFVLDGEPRSVSFAFWLSSYLVVLFLLDIVIVLLAILGELLGGTLLGLVSAGGFILLGLQPAIFAWNVSIKDYFPFAYIDIARAINGMKNGLYGVELSLFKFLQGTIVSIVCLCCLLWPASHYKRKRGQYV